LRSVFGCGSRRYGRVVILSLFVFLLVLVSFFLVLLIFILLLVV
jgi:hypothetical protein